MTTKPYHVLGTVVPNPPEDGGYLAGQHSPAVKLLSGYTVPVFASGGYQFVGGDAIPHRASGNMLYQFQSGLTDAGSAGDGWTNGGGTFTVTFQVQMPADVDGVVGNVGYWESVGGSHEGTYLQITNEHGTGAGRVSKTVDWKANTNQKQWTWVSSPPFSLVRGTQTVTLEGRVADNNTFHLCNFDLLAPPFQAQPLSVSFYWKCLRDTTVTPGGYYSMEKRYSVGLSKESATTSSVATTLGMSASASYDSISAGLSASVSKTLSRTESVTVSQSSTCSDTHRYPNNGDTEMTLQLWQPCVQYNIGPIMIVEEQAGTLLATTQPHSDQSSQP